MQERPDSVGSRGASPRRVYVSLEVVLLGALALGLRLVDLGHPPFIDELHHVLAAGSLLEDGTPTIHEGVPYLRGLVFTYLVTGSFALFGESLEAARLPAVISGVLLVCLLFAWLRVEAGRIAAWTAGLLLCFAPIALYLSQWVRFYTLHALIFWLGVYGVYRIVCRKDPVRRRWWIGAASLVALFLAFRLQVTTAVGIGGLGLFVALTEGPRMFEAADGRRKRWMIFGGLGVVLAAVVGVATLLGFVEWLVDRAARVDVWAMGRADNPRFYHWLFTDQYGFLWVLFPVAALIALAARAPRARLALLYLSVFGVAFVGHSFAAWKAERYLFYAVPAWFAVWGLASAEALPWLWQRLADAGERMLAGFPLVARRAVPAMALLAALGFAATGLSAYTTTRLIYLQGRDWSPPPAHEGERYRGHPDWAAMAPRLAPLSDSVDVVVGEPDMKLIHYLGDVDFILYASYLATMRLAGDPLEMRPEFTVSSKVGRPLVSAPGSIALIMACYGSGLIVAESHVWGWRGGVPRETATFIEQVADPVELAVDSGILAFRWETPTPEESDRCAELHRVRLEAPAGPGS